MQSLKMVCLCACSVLDAAVRYARYCRDLGHAEPTQPTQPKQLTRVAEEPESEAEEPRYAKASGPQEEQTAVAESSPEPAQEPSSQAALVTEAQGLQLHLSSKASTGSARRVKEVATFLARRRLSGRRGDSKGSTGSVCRQSQGSGDILSWAAAEWRRRQEPRLSERFSAKGGAVTAPDAVTAPHLARVPHPGTRACSISPRTADCAHSQLSRAGRAAHQAAFLRTDPLGICTKTDPSPTAPQRLQRTHPKRWNGSHS